MKRLFFYFYLFSLVVLFTLACRPPAKPVTVSNTQISPNNMPPSKNVEDMTWATFAGETQKLKDLQGKIVVLDFWATYCPPCVEGIPHFVELQKKHADLQVIGLHVGGEEDRPKVPKFIEKFNINYTLATPELELIRFVSGNDTSIPQTAIFDKKGNLVKKFAGFDEQIKQQIDATINELVSKK